MVRPLELQEGTSNATQDQRHSKARPLPCPLVGTIVTPGQHVGECWHEDPVRVCPALKACWQDGEAAVSATREGESEYTVTVRRDTDDELERYNPDHAWTWTGNAGYPGDALEQALFAWHAERREAEGGQQ